MFAAWIERILGTIDERLASMPPWARPPFLGMLLVYGMMLFGRGWLLIPLAIIGVLMGGPVAVVRILWVLIVAGLAGFAGGLAYAMVHPILHRLGRGGHVVIGCLAVFVYMATGYFLLGSADPDLRARFDLQRPVSWVIIGAVSLLFGAVLGSMFHTEAPGPDGAGRRRWAQRKQRVTSRVHPPAP